MSDENIKYAIKCLFVLGVILCVTQCNISIDIKENQPTEAEI